MDSATSKVRNIDLPVMEWKLNNQASTHEQHKEEEEEEVTVHKNTVN